MTIRNRLIAFLFFCCQTSVLYAEEFQPRQTESLVFTCYTCHGPQGKSPGAIPSLTQLSAIEIRDKLVDFRQDLGEATIMNRIAKAYSEEEIERIAQYLVEHFE